MAIVVSLRGLMECLGIWRSEGCFWYPQLDTVCREAIHSEQATPQLNHGTESLIRLDEERRKAQQREGGQIQLLTHIPR